MLIDLNGDGSSAARDSFATEGARSEQPLNRLDAPKVAGSRPIKPERWDLRVQLE